MSASVTLTDEELALLDGRCSEKVQAKVTQALARLAARSAGLSPLTADIVGEAREHGEVVYYNRTRIRHCSLCGRQGGYALYKRGPRQGQPNYDRPLTMLGVEFARRFIVIKGSVSVGGCSECVEPLVPEIREALRGVNAQVPAALRADGEPVRVKYRNRHCKNCDWRGHEGEMGRDSTIMGDGSFPSRCPSCNAGGAFDRTIEFDDGFTVVAAAADMSTQEHEPDE